MIKLWQRWFGRTAIAIEPAGPRDAAKLAALHGASFHRGWSEAEFEGLLAERNTLTHRLRAGRHLIGFIISRCAADEAEVLSVAVASSWRGRGLSGGLLRHHLGHLAGRGIHKVFLEVEENNQPAVKLYRRAGFRTVGGRKQYYPQVDGTNLNALIMQRDLS
jgi:ribosomal-protein-alanine N-acetyltransferase